MIRYNYLCTSKTGAGIKNYLLSEQTDMDYIRDKCLFDVSQIVIDEGIPWDPFNVELVIKRHRPSTK